MLQGTWLWLIKTVISIGTEKEIKRFQNMWQFDNQEKRHMYLINSTGQTD